MSKMDSTSSSESCSNGINQVKRKPIIKRYKRPLYADYKEHEVCSQTRKKYMMERLDHSQLEPNSSNSSTKSSNNESAEILQSDHDDQLSVDDDDDAIEHEDDTATKNYAVRNDFIDENKLLPTEEDLQHSSSITAADAFRDSCSDHHSSPDEISVRSDDGIKNCLFEDNNDESSSCFSSDSNGDDIDADENMQDNKFDSVMFDKSHLKVRDIITMISAFSLRFHLSDEGRLALADMLKLCAGPEFEALSLSKYEMERCISNQDEHIQYNYYCTQCFNSILLSTVATNQWKELNVICDKCKIKDTLTKSSSNYFMSIDIVHQLTQILLNDQLLKDVLKNLLTRKNYSKDELITDISGGEIQQQLIRDTKKNSQYLITLNFSTDGAPLTKSGKNAFWPLQITINSLSPKLRNKNVLLAGILIVKKEPKPPLMNLFMSVFVNQIKKLYEDGITITINGNKITFRFCTHSSVVDSVCRPVMQNRLQFNGYNGCSWCYQRGLYIKQCAGVRYVFEQRSDDIRTRNSHKSDVKSALETGKVINGVKGDSILKDLPHYDMIWSFSYEYMHGLLLGACFQIFNEWKSGTSELTISKKNIEAIEKRFLLITPNKEIHRLPRSGIIVGTNKPKASELKSWLLYYSLPCLLGFLPEDLLNHYALLVKSAYCLLKPEITKDNLKTCKEDLTQFVVFYEMFYGKESMTFNIHTLLHVCQSVRKTGLLWTNSAFPFKSNIYTLKTFVKGSKGMDRQMARKSLQIQYFKSAENVELLSDKSKQFVMNLYAPQRLTTFYEKGDGERVTYIGKGRKNNSVAEFPHCIVYTKCIFKGSVYHSIKYTRANKTNDTVIQLNDQRFAIILEILKLDDDRCYLKLLPLNVSDESPFKNVTHIKKIDKINYNNHCNSIFVPVDLIKSKVILIDNINNASYVCTTPNNAEIQ